MSNLSEKDKKFLEKQIAKKVRDELDKEDFEDTAWLKAFSQAKGKKDQAKVNYIDIRSQDLWDAEIENFKAIAQKNQEEKIKKDKAENLKRGKLEFLNHKQQVDKLTYEEHQKYKVVIKRLEAFENGFDDDVTQHNLDREYLRIIYWEKMYKNKKPKIHKAEIEMSSDNLSSKLKKLTKLYKSGTLSKAEFEKAKNKLLK